MKEIITKISFSSSDYIMLTLFLIFSLLLIFFFYPKKGQSLLGSVTNTEDWERKRKEMGKDYFSLMEDINVGEISFGQLRKVIPPEAEIDVCKGKELVESGENYLIENAYNDDIVAEISIYCPAVVYFKVVLK